MRRPHSSQSSCLRDPLDVARPSFPSVQLVGLYQRPLFLQEPDNLGVAGRVGDRQHPAELFQADRCNIQDHPVTTVADVGETIRHSHQHFPD